MKRLIVALLALIGFSVVSVAQQVTPSSSASIGWATGSLGAGTTNYTVPGGVGTVLTVGALVSKTTNISNLQVRVAIQPASAQTDVFTVYVGAPASMTATSVTCTIPAGANVCSDTTDSVSIAPGQAWAVQVVTGATNATGQQMFSIQMSP